jgi:prolyl-tRNA synthetase
MAATTPSSRTSGSGAKVVGSAVAKTDAPKTAITPTRQEDYTEWYQQVVRAADLAEPSPVRGCMVIKPWGYALWEQMQRQLDAMFKATGHKNAYFPLFIPKSFLEKEAAHVEGFAKECAVVTHHRLIAGPEGGLIVDPNARLEEPLIVRPTSETIIGDSFSKWVQSYRDLPLLINQWANVVRWELRTRLFLRTTEFLWQEGHTAHATEVEAREETRRMLEVYATFAEEHLAMPVLKGPKTASERFPGAVDTYSIEAMMQDRKALQAGTSHFLGQNFSRASNIRFQTREEKEEFAWTTSWGVSTRLVGALIMTHADDDGLVLPPRIAPAHAVVLPVLREPKPGEPDPRPKVLEFIDSFVAELRDVRYGGRNLEIEVDTRDLRGPEKQWEWVKRGVPLRLEVGPRDVEAGTVMLARRDRGPKDKISVPRAELADRVLAILAEIQDGLLDRARRYRAEHSRAIDTRSEFDAFFTPKNADKPEAHGGFALSHWCGDAKCEASIKDALKVTIRCIADDLAQAVGKDVDGRGKCICCGSESPRRVVFAKSY